MRFRKLLLVAAIAAVLSGCAAEPTRVRVAVVTPGVAVTVREAPPPLPYYEQPPCPEVGYLWTPGYWAWGAEGYYWVPGTWVQPPRVGVLWTPGYWGWSSGVYIFHAGYWGPHVGFYGGVVYGGGYVGTGFVGGRWESNHFNYNSAVTNVNTTIVHNTYHETVVNNVTVNNVTVNNVSYNGGPNGSRAAPTANEQAAEHENHVQPTQQQMKHVTEAGQNRALLAHVNQGHPTIAATPRASAFSAPDVVPARAAPQAVKAREEIPAANHPENSAPRADRPNQDRPAQGMSNEDRPSQNFRDQQKPVNSPATAPAPQTAKPAGATAHPPQVNNSHPQPPAARTPTQKPPGQSPKKHPPETKKDRENEEKK